mmetsp:Transcript_10166/g.20532  ORF Transcript_10166/g.20532 Transcript_10166/m.20532 type:complete len:113 (-) Transcript_10166:1488-1826(-)
MSAPKSMMNLSTEDIQRILDENQHLILAVMENKNLGRLAEALQFQSKLQQNLITLASIADQQPMRVPHGVAGVMGPMVPSSGGLPEAKLGVSTPTPKLAPQPSHPQHPPGPL